MSLWLECASNSTACLHRAKLKANEVFAGVNTVLLCGWFGVWSRTFNRVWQYSSTVSKYLVPCTFIRAEAEIQTYFPTPRTNCICCGTKPQINISPLRYCFLHCVYQLCSVCVARCLNKNMSCPTLEDPHTFLFYCHPKWSLCYICGARFREHLTFLSDWNHSATNKMV